MKKALTGVAIVALTGVVGTGIFMSMNKDNVKVEALEGFKGVSTLETQTDKEKKNVEVSEEQKDQDQAQDQVSEETAAVEKEQAVKEEETINPSSSEQKTVASQNNVTSAKSNTQTAVKTETKTITVTETIAFGVVRQNDSSLDKGQQVVVQNGQNGSKTMTYKETYQNGQSVSKVFVSEQVTKQPVNQIIKVGTKESGNGEGILLQSGLFVKSGNTYFYDDSVKVTVSNGRVTQITFNGSLYHTIKGATLEQLINDFGEQDGRQQYDKIQNEVKRIESALRTATSAAGSSGSYNQMIQQLSSTMNF